MNNKKTTTGSEASFMKNLGSTIFYLLLIQVLFTSFLYIFWTDAAPVQYFNVSAYFFMFLISLYSLRLAIANRPLVILLLIQFFLLAVMPLILIASRAYSYNLDMLMYRLDSIILSAGSILITTYMFFYAISPSSEKTKSHIFAALFITTFIIVLIYFDVKLFINYEELVDTEFYKSFEVIRIRNNYIYILNFSFLLFVWYIYNQRQFILSEYLPSILSLHTLMIINEVYHFTNSAEATSNFIEALYFNALINVGFILILIIRLIYLKDPKNIENEKYVLNYDLLKGYIQKPTNSFWYSLLIKLGKQKFYFGSLVLFLIICIPLLFFGDFSSFMRFNIVLMLGFLAIVMIYAIIYTQRKWYHHIGFLINRKEKK